MLKSEPARPFEGVSNQTFNAVPGIVFAGSIYAVATTFVSSVGWFWFSSPSIASVEQAVGAIALSVIIGVVFAFCLAFSSFVATIAMTIFNMTLGYAIPALTAGGLIGGLTGLIVGGVFVLPIGDLYRRLLGQEYTVALSILLGPIAGAVTCHLGAWYQVRKFHFLLAAESLPEEGRSEEALLEAVTRFDDSGTLDDQLALMPEPPVAAQKVHPLDEPDEISDEQFDARPVPSSHSVPSRRHTQWSLRQGFVLMTWVGLIVALAAAVPEAGEPLAIGLGFYAIVELLSFGVLFCVWKRLDRRLGRVIHRFFQDHPLPGGATESFD